MVRNVITGENQVWLETYNLASSPTRRINYFRLSSCMITPSENGHFRFTLRRISLGHDFRLNMLIYRIIIAIH